VFALEFADELETVASGQAGGLLRERIASVGTEGRRLLREALDGVEATSSP
jgi:hypothetical protein